MRLTVADLLAAMKIDEALGQSGFFILIVFTLLQIAPVKINPWSWLGHLVGSLFGQLARKVGRAINGEVITELGVIRSKLDDLEQNDRKQDATRAEDKALDARRRILQFADEIRREIRHSEEHFNNVFEDIKFYNGYCQEHPKFANDKARISISIIESTYEKCVRENIFL